MYTAIWDDAKRPPYGCLLVALFFALKTLYLVLNLQYICVCVFVHTYFSYIGPQATEPTHKLSKLRAKHCKYLKHMLNGTMHIQVQYKA